MEVVKKSAKGFTLIELLVVIGILAVLSVVVVLTLNPAELLKQARDSTRISDLGTIKSAVSLYQVDQSTQLFGDSAVSYYTSGGAGTAPTALGCDPSGTPTARFAGNGTCVAAGSAVDGTGWVRVPMNQISANSGGSPISNLPIDPSNNYTNNLFYAYRAGGSVGCNDAGTLCTTYEINATLESAKFAAQAANDGGNSNTAPNNIYYEIGTDPGLDL